MASVSSVSSSNLTSSLYNSANIVSGLASGLDTEGMIEGLVQSYQTKIQTLTNSATKLEWKQEAYRSIISKMNAFANQYTSYTSSTNLLSSSFFTSAVKVAAMGTYADKVTASGRTDSEVKLNSVSQLASAARYTTNSNLNPNDTGFNIEGEAINLEDTIDMGTLSGSLTLNYGGKTVSIVFDSSTDMIANDLSAGDKAAELAKLIEKKLGDSTITLSNGETKNAADLIGVTSDSSGNITFKDKSTGGNTVYLSGASGTVDTVLGLKLDNASEDKPSSFQVTGATRLTKSPTRASLISGGRMTVSLDGKSASIYLPRVTSDKDGNYVLTMPTVTTDKNGSISVAYNGTQKVCSKSEYADVYADMVNTAMQKEFGTKIQVSNIGGQDEDGNSLLQLKFEAPENSALIVNSDAGDALGIGKIATNYLNTSNTLGDLNANIFSGLTAAKGVGDITSTENGKYVDSEGNLVNAAGYRVDSDGNELYELKINDIVIGCYNESSKLSDIMNDINNSAAGVKISYSQTTRNFTFTSKDTGAENKIELGDGLAQAMFGSTNGDSNNFSKTFGLDLGDGERKRVAFENDEFGLAIYVTNTTTMEEVAEQLNATLASYNYTAAYNETSGQLIVTDENGKVIDLKVSADGEELEPQYTSSYTPGRDAVFQVEVNGQTLNMTRASNNVSIDGMTLNFKGTFEAEEGDEVTFQISTDSDKIIDAVKQMVADFNEMMSEIRAQYATLPYQSSSGAFQTYEPLSDEDKATMSESAIQNYEAKAKQGILFNDSNLSTLYERMRSIFTSGSDWQLMQQIGISISYSSTDNSASLTLDESKLRTALDNDVDAVADLFTRSVESGAESNGIMQSIKAQLDRYAGLTGATKGILVEQAGTPLSSLSLLNNTWQSQIDSIGDDITTWQEKLSAQVDKYTSMFSKLETLIYQMNSQSSTLAGLMGG